LELAQILKRNDFSALRQIAEQATESAHTRHALHGAVLLIRGLRIIRKIMFWMGDSLLENNNRCNRFGGYSGQKLKAPSSEDNSSTSHILDRGIQSSESIFQIMDSLDAISYSPL